MPKLALLLSFVNLLVCSTISAQENSCEVMTLQTLPRLTTALHNNDFDQIESHLLRIEATCGRTEFTQRVRIISLMIQKQNTNAEIHYYLRNYLDHRLIDRLEAAADQNYVNTYNSDKATFDYVPLRNSVDSLIIQKSAALLGSELYKLNDAEETVAFLFSDHINTYLTRMKQEVPGARSMGGSQRPAEHVRRQRGFGKDGGIFLSAGTYTPMNAVNPIFGTNPIFGVGFVSDLDNDFVVDLFFKARLNNKDRDFEYAFRDDIYWVNSSASYMLGGSVGYKFLDVGRFLSIAKVGVASERVNTGLSETFYIDRRFWTESRTRRHRIRTYNLSAGLSVMQHVHGKSFIGLQAQYHYSPYHRDRNVLTPIASDYVSFELFFKF